MSSETYSYLYEQILEKGALDIYTEGIFMKKNRPSYKITVLCKEKDLDKFTKLLLVETSTFGVRYQKLKRVMLERKFEKIETKYGNIQIKLGYLNGELIKVTPEYEDCKIIAYSPLLIFLIANIMKYFETTNFFRCKNSSVNSKYLSRIITHFLNHL